MKKMNEKEKKLINDKMIDERKKKLLDNKIISYRKEFIQFHVKLERDYWPIFNDKDEIEKYKGDTIQEKIYRYLIDFNDDVCCLWCGNKTKFRTIYNGFDDYCSTACVKQYIQSKGTFTTKDWKHTEESKEKMKKNHADFTGNNNPFKKACKINPELRKQSSEIKKNWWKNLSDERRKDISDKSSKSQANRSDFNYVHKNYVCGCFISKKMNRSFYFRSSWELKICEYLESKDDIQKFTLEEFCIEYNKKGLTKHARIDFLINQKNNTYLFEVKPKALISSNLYKIKAMQKYCIENNINFFVITKSELGTDYLNEIFDGKIENENFKRFEQ